MNKPHYIIEICPHEPRASICSMTGESVANDPDIADCRASGDCEPACTYVRDRLGVQFRRIARNPVTGEYENRLVTYSELDATAHAIYFESDIDFSDRATAELYLIWDAANSCEGEE